MNSFKKILYLYKEDWKRIFKSPMAIVVLIALMILPSFYAWFNIKALWDPYSNTRELPVAVYSADQTTNTQIMGKDISLSIGDEVVDNLKHNDDIGWKFVKSKKDLVEGVKSGKYYAGIYLRKDFSKNLLSIVNGEIHKPIIDYYVNEKINAIAPRITEKGAGAIQDTITKSFIGAVSHTLFSAMNKLGIDLDSHIVDITKLKNFILNTDANLDEIDGYLNEVVNLDSKMPAIEDKVAKINQLVQTGLPKVNELGDKVVEADKNLPGLTKKLEPILTLQQKIPEIQNAGRQVQMIDEDFGKINDTLNSAIDNCKQGLSVLQEAQNAIPKIEEAINNANGFVDSTQENIQKVQDALPQMANTVSTSLSLVKSICSDVINTTNSLSKFINDNELSDQDKKDMAQLAQTMADNLGNLNNLLTNTINMLTQMQNAAGNNKLDGVINQLNQIKNVSQDIQSHAEKLASSIPNLSTDEIKSLLNNLNQLAQQLQSAANSINVDSISQSLNDMINQLKNTLSSSKEALSAISKIDAKSLMTNTSETLNQALALLEKYQKEMPAVGQEIHDANMLLNGNMNNIIDAINKGALFYTDGLPIVQQRLDAAANFIQNDLPNIESRLTNMMAIVNEKLPVAEDGLNMATDIIQNDWPLLKQGIQSMANQIRSGENKVNVEELVKLLKGNIKKETNFMQTPVKVKEHALYPIPTYGAASTPFYTVLCLWVGGLLMASLISTDVYFKRKGQKQQVDLDKEDMPLYGEDDFTRRQTYIARMLSFMTIGMVQALIVALGNIFLLHVYIKQPVMSVLFALLIEFCFVCVIYTVVGLFKDPGKAMAIIILVLSVAGGGGNFPIQLSSKFFQHVYPLMPATYGYNLMREASGGIYWPNAQFDISILLLFAVSFLIIGIWVAPYVEKLMKKFTENVEKAHFFN